ncbi:MAG TPA: hypothetical protein VK923_20880 [Euzebyales bacterium]|nr:hypothetical protein [Euzebyales bacterium]
MTASRGCRARSAGGAEAVDGELQPGGEGGTPVAAAVIDEQSPDDASLAFRELRDPRGTTA